MSAISLKKLLKEVTNALKADYVVEQGTSGRWTYRKWNSGIAECWGFYSESIAANTLKSNVYVAYPTNLFVAKPTVIFSLEAGGAQYYSGWVTNAGDNDATQCRLSLRNTYTSAVTLGGSIHAIGSWK